MNAASILIAALIQAVLLAVPVYCFIKIIYAIFFREQRNIVRTNWTIYAGLFAVWLAFLFTALPSQHLIRASKIARSNNDAAVLQRAILAYHTEYDDWPASTDNAKLVRILTGHNWRKIMFLSLSPREMNDRGEMVDAWQRPFHISFADPDHPEVISDPPPPQ